MPSETKPSETKMLQDGSARSVQQGFETAMMPMLALFKTNAEFGAEYAAFWSRRFQAHADYWRNFAKCKDAEDVARVQGSFLRSMTKDYGAEASSLITAAGSQLESAAETLNHGLIANDAPNGPHTSH